MVLGKAPENWDFAAISYYWCGFVRFHVGVSCAYLLLFDGCQAGREISFDAGLVRVLPKLASARVAELVDALASGASARKGVGVQVPPRAREQNSP